MGYLLLITLLTLPFLAQIRQADAGCCCCCCPSCCCKPIIIKLPPPPVKLCPCCCGCCCCNKCCCCRPCCCCCCRPCCCCCCRPCCCCCPCCCGGGGRRKRSVVDMMARKFSDVLLPQHNQDAIMSGMNGGGCGGAVNQPVSMSPLHTLCSQIPPAQRGPACQQITQQFPLGQNIFNHPQSGMGSADFDCANCANCQAGNCQGCTAAGAQGTQGCPNCVGGQQCNGAMCAGAGGAGAFHPGMGGDDNTFNLAQNYGTPCSGAGAGMGGGRRRRRSLALMRDAQRKTPFAQLVFPPSASGKVANVAVKREVKNQLVFRNNLEFVLRQTPPAVAQNL